MDCRSVRELADSFLSEQLLVETNHEVLRHLETCAACRAELAARGAIRERLRGAFGSAPDLAPRTALAAELAARLRPAAEPVSRRTLLQSWWATAAGVALAGGGGALIVRRRRSRSQLVALAITAAGDHQNCAITFNLAERPISLQDAARRFGMPYGQMASFDMPALVPAAEILERHSCVYNDHRFAHVVLRYRGAVTSLLVARGDAPAEPAIEARTASAVVASLPAGDFVAFVVAALPEDDVLQLARTLAPAIERHLSA
jgi:LPXTG-motif cell wall-anchored protein